MPRLLFERSRRVLDMQFVYRLRTSVSMLLLLLLTFLLRRRDYLI
jgi:hypothetical protein